MYSQSRVAETSCAFCGRVLRMEYHFTCHVCGATYCYIHQSKHSRAHRVPVSTGNPSS